MPFAQDVFTVIPARSSFTATVKPPMTSRQAKRAHSKRDAVPRMSKEERRQWERDEIAKNNAELDRRRAAAKAKIVRDRKADKEKQARDERKRAGVPEKSKWVRPSQPTIAEFARLRKEDSEDRSATSATSSAVSNNLCDSTPSEDEESQVRITEVVPSSQGKADKVGPRLKTKAIVEIPRRSASRHDAVVDDEYGEFPDFTQSDMPRLLMANGKTTHQDKEQKGLGISLMPVPLSPKSTSSSLDLAMDAASRLVAEAEEADKKSVAPTIRAAPLRSSPRLFSGVPHRTSTPKKSNIGSSPPVAGSRGIIRPAVVEVKRTSPAKPISNPQKNAALEVTSTSSSKPTSGAEGVKRITDSSNEPKSSILSTTRFLKSSLKATAPTVMLPPPPPPRRLPLLDLKPNVMAPPPAVHKPKPHFLYEDVKKNIQAGWIPPSTAVAFLEANMDDFFPSPSQSVRELVTDLDDFDMPSNTQVARDISGERHEPRQPQLPATMSKEAIKVPTASHTDDVFFSSQDFVLSSQDLREIDTPSKPLQRPSGKTSDPRQTSCSPSVSASMSKTGTIVAKSSTASRPQFKGASTIKIATPAMHVRPSPLSQSPSLLSNISPPQHKRVVGNNMNNLSTKLQQSPSSARSPSSPKKQLYTSLHSSCTTTTPTFSNKQLSSAPPQPVDATNANNTPSIIAPKPIAAEPTKSPKSNNTSSTTAPKSAPKRPFFEEKDEDLLQAAIDESLRLAQLQRAAEQMPRKKRLSTPYSRENTYSRENSGETVTAGGKYPKAFRIPSEPVTRLQRGRDSPMRASQVRKSQSSLKPSTSTFRRVPSLQSDNGEFELGGDEKDLLALLERVERT